MPMFKYMLKWNWCLGLAIVVWPPCCFEMYSSNSWAWIIAIFKILSDLGAVFAHLVGAIWTRLFSPLWLGVCPCRLWWRPLWTQWLLQQPKLPQQVPRKHGVYLVYHHICGQQHHPHYPWVWCGVSRRLQLWCAGSKIWTFLSAISLG